MNYIGSFRLISLIICCFLHFSLWAQHPSAIADYESTEKGILIPRMSEIQRTAIASPAIGLLVYETDSQNFWFFNGVNWISLAIIPADNLGNHTATQQLDMAGSKVLNLAEPDSAQDAATKNYVDSNDDVDDADSDPDNELQDLGQVLGEGNDAGNTRITKLAEPDSAQDAATKNYVDNQLGSLFLDHIRDADNDTRILVEKNTDEDTIRFEIAGVELARMDESNFHVDGNVIIKGSIDIHHPDDTTSLFIGRNAGVNTDFSFQRFNTFLGTEAGKSSTTSDENSFFGHRTGTNTTFGSVNSFFGSSAGLNNVNGFDNSFFGARAGMHNIDGFDNSFYGSSAGSSNTDGRRNTFIGKRAGRSNISGDNNVFIGTLAGRDGDSTNNNVMIGYEAGRNNQEDFNTFVGHRTGRSNTTGNFNAFFGQQAGFFNTAGEKNVFIGSSAGKDGDSTSNNVMIGFEAGFENQADGNTFVGYESGTSNTDGSGNSFFGRSSGANNEDGFNNSLFGFRAGVNNDSGHENSFFGMEAGRNNTTGYRNAFFGEKAGENNTTGFENSFFGESSGINNEAGSGNAFFGRNAGQFNISGSNNSFFGWAAGNDNQSGSFNSFFGDRAGHNTSGSFNSFFGTLAGYNNTNGTRNTFIGYQAAQLVFTDSVDRAIALGYNAKVDCHNCAAIGGTGEDAVKVGIGTALPEYTLDVNGEMIVRDEAGIAFFQSTTANSFVRFQNTGDASGTSVGYFDDNSSEYFFVDLPGSPFGEFVIRSNGRVGINDITPDFLLDVNGTAGKPGGGSWSNASDARLKKDVLPYADGLAEILKIEPVTYHYNELSGKDTRPEYVGIIAQEIQQIVPYMVTQNLKIEGQEEEYLSFDGSALTYMLINGMKEQQVQIEEQQQMIGELQTEKEKWDRQQEEIGQLRTEKIQWKKQQEEIAELRLMVEQFMKPADTNLSTKANAKVKATEDNE